MKTDILFAIGGADARFVEEALDKGAAAAVSTRVMPDRMVLTVPDTHIILQPSLGIVPLQLFAYYVALQRGCDIDKPRNLAKSVTVE